jgi:hypothetical protein
VENLETDFQVRNFRNNCYYHGATTLSIMTFRITTLYIMGLFTTLSINDNQLSSMEWHYAVSFEWHFFSVLLSVIMLNVVMLSVVAPLTNLLTITLKV